MTGNKVDETPATETPKWLVDLIINQDQVGQKWIEFLITIEAGLVVALGFLMRPTEGTNAQSGTVIKGPPHATLYLIPAIGILVAISLTWIVVRERKWQTWYVARFNLQPGCANNVFPVDKGKDGPVASQPLGRISEIIIGLGIIIFLMWIAVIFWAIFSTT